MGGTSGDGIEKRRIVVAGGSGLLGQILIPALRYQGYAIINLTRTPRDSEDTLWDGKTVGGWSTYLDGAWAVINLAGHTLYCRHTSENRRAIIDSHIETINALGSAIRQSSTPPSIWIQASSLRFYGDADEVACLETSLPGEGFSAAACLLSERAFTGNPAPATRKVLLRIGEVLSADSGTLPPLVRRAHRFLGGAAGNGRQYVNWLHYTDLSRILLWILESDSATGIYNAVAPAPIRNVAFMAMLRRVIKRPWSPPIPRQLFRLSSPWRNIAPELELTGSRCIPERLIAQGFTFTYPDVESALRQILARSL